MTRRRPISVSQALAPSSISHRAVAVLSFLTVLVGFAALAQAGAVNTDDGVILHGYDPVAYFTENKPVKGSAAHSTVHNGATYYFASAGNKATFEADPTRYAPQYGGYCAYGAAHGYKVDVDPGAFSIVDGKLYLNLNRNVQSRFETDIPGFIRSADHNWPIIENVDRDTLKENQPDGLKIGAS